MIIGIDVRPLAGLNSGIQEYTNQIVSRIIREHPEHQFKLFYSSLKTPLPGYEWMELPNVRIYRYKVSNALLFLAGRMFKWPKLDVLMGGADVFFSPHFVIAPLSASCRRVTTFHDLSFERFPGFFTFKQRAWHYLMNPRAQSKFSERIIAVSHSTKADLVEYYHIDPSNIVVVHNASSVIKPDEAALKSFKEKENLPDCFIFSLGTLEPRKNTAGIVRAFNILKSKSGYEDVQLLIGGARGWKCKDVFAEIKKSPHAKDIRYLGYLFGSRASYYSLAELFVYPSFFEGFGLPVLEAMSCGTPVITSANSSMPEVAGTAAVLVDPYNISSIASAMENVLSNKDLAESLATKSTQQAQLFSWDKAAQETLKVIHRG